MVYLGNCTLYYGCNILVMSKGYLKNYLFLFFIEKGCKSLVELVGQGMGRIMFSFWLS